MAIIPELGITVVIHANGQPLTEYDDPEPSVEHPGTGAEIRTCHKFVQSVDGANFSVEVQAVHVPQAAWLWESPKTCLRFVVYVDGARASGTLVSRFDPSQSCSKSFKGRRRDDRWIQKFTFSRIQTVDETPDAACLTREYELARNLGFIVVKVRRFIKGNPSVRKNRHKDNRGTNEGFAFHEKSLKGRAISHGTIYSQPEPVAASNHYSTHRLDKHDLAVFSFKYRSREGLQAEMVIPSSTSESPPPSSSRMLDEMSPEELRRLAQERLEQLKKEYQPAIKVEEALHPLNFPGNGNIEDPICLDDD